ALHATPVDRVEGIAPRDATPPAEWLAEARDAYQVVAPGLPGADRQRVEAFLDAPPPAPPAVAVLCHNDLGAEHLLVDGEPPAVVVTGVIDWGEAALGDPAVDLARLHRDLGPAAAEAIRRRDDGLIGDEDLDRVAFYARCALLEDLAYGVRSGDERYRRAALAHLARTFACAAAGPVSAPRSTRRSGAGTRRCPSRPAGGCPCRARAPGAGSG